MIFEVLTSGQQVYMEATLPTTLDGVKESSCVQLVRRKKNNLRAFGYVLMHFLSLGGSFEILGLLLKEI